MVTLEAIMALNPCEDRLNNYIKHYGTKVFTVEQFLALENISTPDKYWVAFRLMPKKNIRFAVGEIAKSVLSVYEINHPNDNRPREAIDRVLAKNFDISSQCTDNAYSAVSAARMIANFSITSASYYAAAAAYHAICAASHTADATTYDSATASRDASSVCGAAILTGREAQYGLNFIIIGNYWK